jgi:hypothetical protein
MALENVRNGQGPEYLNAMGFGQSSPGGYGAQQSQLGGAQQGQLGNNQPSTATPIAGPTSGAGGTSFSQANAARQTSDVQRQLALARGELEQKGQQERQGINYDAEDRGIYNSGIRGQSIAVQQGMEANKAAQLEAGAQADIGNIQGNLQQQLANEQAAREQQAAGRELSQAQLEALRSQTGNQSALAQAQLAELQRQSERNRQLYDEQLRLLRLTGGSTP